MLGFCFIQGTAPAVCRAAKPGAFPAARQAQPGAARGFRGKVYAACRRKGHLHFHCASSGAAGCDKRGHIQKSSPAGHTKVDAFAFFLYAACPSFPEARQELGGRTRHWDVPDIATTSEGMSIRGQRYPIHPCLRYTCFRIVSIPSQNSEGSNKSF